MTAPPTSWVLSLLDIRTNPRVLVFGSSVRLRMSFFWDIYDLFCWWWSDAFGGEMNCLACLQCCLLEELWKRFSINHCLIAIENCISGPSYRCASLWINILKGTWVYLWHIIEVNVIKCYVCCSICRITWLVYAFQPAEQKQMKKTHPGLF